MFADGMFKEELMTDLGVTGGTGTHSNFILGSNFSSPAFEFNALMVLLCLRILVWEDGFCNFAASAAVNHSEMESSSCSGGPLGYGNCELQHLKGLQPDLFFKMSHEIYNYGEGLIGKVASDHSHKWIYKEPQEHEINFLSAWNNPADSLGSEIFGLSLNFSIQGHGKPNSSPTIALIAVREGVVQLGAVNKFIMVMSNVGINSLKVVEDLSYVVLLRKKFSYLENIPGVLLPHPSSSGFPFKVDSCNPPDSWSYQGLQPHPAEYHDQFNQPLKITPSMTSLEALLSKLPPVEPAPSGSPSGYYEAPLYISSQRPLELMGMSKVAKEEADEECGHGSEMDFIGESSNSMSSYHFDQKLKEPSCSKLLDEHQHVDAANISCLSGYAGMASPISIWENALSKGNEGKKIIGDSGIGRTCKSGRLKQKVHMADNSRQYKDKKIYVHFDRSTPTTTDVGAASCHPPKSILSAPPPWSIFPAG
ncbi:hypothetical protein ACLOJK_035352 [Asimina triloba]